ncbi:MAG TPA: hypothetical protein VL400_09735 [Polyangiaceae bacterium]|nr:hypothetical protein [Polyangiaceae bacterium]
MPRRPRSPGHAILSFAALSLACGGEPASVAPTYAPVAAPPPAPTVSVSPTSSAQPEASAAVAAPPSVPPTPRLVVLDQTVSTAPLFADELPKIEDAALAALSKLPATRVVPRSEVAHARTLAAAGRARDGGPKCLRPPTAGTLLARKYPDAVGATLWTSCFGASCSTQIDVHDALLPEGHYDDRFVDFRVYGDVADPVSVDAWVASLANPPSPEAATHGGGIGGIGFGWSIGDGPLELKHIEAQFGFEPALEAATLPPKLFESCREAGTSTTFEVDGKGAVRRCEPASCPCRVIAKQSFGAGKAHRRARLLFDRSGALGGQGGLALGHGGLGGKSAPLGSLGRAKGHLAGAHAHPLVRVAATEGMSVDEMSHLVSLGTCVNAESAGGQVPLRLTLSETGKVTAVAFPEQSIFDAAEKKCLEKAVKTFAFTCPPEGDPTTQIVLIVSPTKKR